MKANKKYKNASTLSSHNSCEMLIRPLPSAILSAVLLNYDKARKDTKWIYLQQQAFLSLPRKEMEPYNEHDELQ